MALLSSIIKHTNLRTNQVSFSSANFTRGEISQILENNLQDFEGGKLCTVIVGTRKTEIKLITNDLFN